MTRRVLRLSPRGLVSLVALVFAVTMTVHVLPLGNMDRWLVHAINDIAHVVGFLCTAIVFLFALDTAPATAGWSAGARRVAVLCLVLALGAASECAQAFAPGRSPDWGDLVRDMAGGGIGVVVVAALGMPRRIRLVLLFASAVALALVVRTPVGIVAATASADADQQLRFEPFLDRYRVGLASAQLQIRAAPEGWPTAGRIACVAPLGRRNAEGADLHNLPRDWSRYTGLKFVIAADDGLDALDLRLESGPVEGPGHGGIRIALPVGPAPREVTLTMAEIAGAPPRRPPGIGPLDLGDVRGVTLITRSRTLATFCLDDIRLE